MTNFQPPAKNGHCFRYYQIVRANLGLFQKPIMQIQGHKKDSGCTQDKMFCQITLHGCTFTLVKKTFLGSL